MHDGNMTQSGVILHYLAEETGRFGGAGPDEAREVLRWILLDNHKFTTIWRRSVSCSACRRPGRRR